MTEILDASKSYLRIFINNNFVIDYSLPKYRPLLEKLKVRGREGKEPTGLDDEVSKMIQGYLVDGPRRIDTPPPYKAYQKGLALMKDLTAQLVDKEFFENLTADDLTLIIDREKGKGLVRKFYNPDAVWEVEAEGTPDHFDGDTGNNVFNAVISTSNITCS